MGLFDTHCHLDREEFKQDLPQIIAEAKSAGVSHMLVPGCSMENWERVEEIASLDKNIYFALGLHPYFTDTHKPAHIHLLKQRLDGRSDKCVAIGECGLDFYHSRNDEALQKQLLTEQILLAKQFNLPLILHCRKAHQDLISILKRHQPLPGGVIHGFTGSEQQAMDFINLGFYIGVGGTITYERAAKTRRTISALPLSSLVLETDSPDMPLFGYQGMNNQPKRTAEVLKSLILLRSEGEQTVANMLFVNSKRLYGICE
ncbi:TatD family hydrolase [Vibrio sp. JC009]|uniref:TatD family hydrolase n=1 Tax=Vibrio sp. JC009 TaxID=2912314 RepID=UPI0023AF089A|nr:TatD family hydrolase [Vibrio sp. JC009]WED21217.1 TatD family hydrolase [Vibrio sp. JC009]